MEKLSENTYSARPLLRRFAVGERTKFMGRLPSWLKNKYMLTGAFFVIWMFFFDPKDILTGADRTSKLNELETSEKHLKLLITESHQELDLLKNNARSIEKYAREKYMMKKGNEDLFIVNLAQKDK